MTNIGHITYCVITKQYLWAIAEPFGESQLSMKMPLERN